MKLSDQLKTQISLTEWFANINHAKTDEMREEDKTKRDRLEKIATIIEFPVEERTVFLVHDIAHNSDKFQTFYTQNKDNLFALRLTPNAPGLQKLRTRGDTLEEIMQDWFPSLNIDPNQYNANFVRHPKDNLWSTIFVVNEHGIFGEIIQASHNTLTQGFYENVSPISFSFDFSTWNMSEDNEKALTELQRIAKFLKVENLEIQQKLHQAVDATFSHHYINGYFETVTTSDLGLHFIDYNRVLADLYKDAYIHTHADSTTHILQGQTGSPGMVRGSVKIVEPHEITKTEITKSDILVCKMTSPDYVQLMSKAGGVITDLGGMLCHAAIVSRELGVPCLVGTKESTIKLTNGMNIMLNATDGYVTT